MPPLLHRAAGSVPLVIDQVQIKTVSSIPQSAVAVLAVPVTKYCRKPTETQTAKDPKNKNYPPTSPRLSNFFRDKASSRKETKHGCKTSNYRSPGRGTVTGNRNRMLGGLRTPVTAAVSQK